MKNKNRWCGVLFARSFVFLCALSAIFYSSNTQAQSLAQDRNFVKGEVIVQYKDFNQTTSKFSNGVSQADFAKKYSLIQKEKVAKDILLFKIKDSMSVEKKIIALEKDPNIEYAQPNFKYTPFDLGTNDPHKDLLWGLDNFGQRIQGSYGDITGLVDADIDMSGAWSINEGVNDSVVVAVIDDGVLYFHPDLEESMWNGRDCKDENGNTLGGCMHGFDYDDNDETPLPVLSSHGTHIAGIIAATKNNLIGVAGVAPNAKIMALRTSYTTVDNVKSINFAKHNGAKVINASWGCYAPPSQGGRHLLCDGDYDFGDRTLRDAITAFPGIFIAAAGNGRGDGDSAGDDHDGQNLHSYPCDLALENIICVTATDQKDNIASFADYGPVSVDVGAPGTNIFSTTLDNTEYNFMDGTSMATPYVSGLSALLWGYIPNLSQSDIKNLVLTTGDNLPALSGKTVTGKRINALNAMSAVPFFTPNNLSVAKKTSNSLQVSFNDNSYNETEFRVERKTGISGTWSQIMVLPEYLGIGSRSWVNGSLLPGTTYCYRVRVFNGVMYSGYSNEACMTTFQPPRDDF